MRVQRGLFRFWIVASVLWAIGFIGWSINDAYEFHQQLAQKYCDPLALPTEDYVECWDRYAGPPGGSTWWWTRMKNTHWIILVFPPFLALIAGSIILKVGTWVVRGFRS